MNVLNSLLAGALAAPLFAPFDVTVTRLGDRPIITRGLDASIGQNIQGPSLVAVPK